MEDEIFEDEDEDEMKMNESGMWGQAVPTSA
jgi:hypothetical protein